MWLSVSCIRKLYIFSLRNLDCARSHQTVSTAALISVCRVTTRQDSRDTIIRREAGFCFGRCALYGLGADVWPWLVAEMAGKACRAPSARCEDFTPLLGLGDPCGGRCQQPRHLPRCRAAEGYAKHSAHSSSPSAGG